MASRFVAIRHRPLRHCFRGPVRDGGHGGVPQARVRRGAREHNLFILTQGAKENPRYLPRVSIFCRNSQDLARHFEIIIMILKVFQKLFITG